MARHKRFSYRPTDQSPTDTKLFSRRIVWTYLGLSVVTAAFAVLGLNWFHMVKSAHNTEKQLKVILDRGNSDGYAFAYFYEGRIRVTAQRLSDGQLEQILSVLSKTEWLVKLEIFAANLDSGDYQQIRDTFPNVSVAVDW